MICLLLLGGLWDVAEPPETNIWTPAVVDASEDIAPSRAKVSFPVPAHPAHKPGLETEARRVWGVVRYERVGLFRRKPVYGWKNTSMLRPGASAGNGPGNSTRSTNQCVGST